MEIKLETRNKLVELIKKATVNKVVNAQEIIDYIATLQTDQHCGTCTKNVEGVCRVKPFLPIGDCYPRDINSLADLCTGYECEYGCSYQEPYGFVPKAGCPIHD